MKLAKKMGATVYGDNKSKGLAFRFREVTNIVLERGIDAMTNIDGDLQFNPEDITEFIAPIVADEADFFISNHPWYIIVVTWDTC